MKPVASQRVAFTSAIPLPAGLRLGDILLKIVQVFFYIVLPQLFLPPLRNPDEDPSASKRVGSNNSVCCLPACSQHDCGQGL